jgi:glutathione S-transferase
MLLIGMFDSPFVRRVAVTLKHLGLPFEHGNWSVGRDFERIREFNPLGRVPTLVLNDGSVLIESASILDYLDDWVGPSRALLPASGTARREALQLIALAIGAAEKGRDAMYAGMLRAPEKRDPQWVERCLSQMHGALAPIDRACASAGAGQWLIDGRFTQADITATCVYTFLNESVKLDGAAGRYRALAELAQRCEALAAFKETYAPWFMPAIAS